MQVDARVGPEAKAGQVGDRGDDRDLQAPESPKLAEDCGRAGIGGDDHVGIVGADRLSQPPPTQEVANFQSQPAGGRKSGEQEVLRLEQPGEPVEREPGSVADHQRHQASHRTQTVHHPHLDPWRFGAQLGREGARRQLMTLPDVGREDQYPPGVVPDAPPGQVAAEAIRERSLRRPAELARRAFAGDVLTVEVGASSGGMDDPGVADPAPHRLGNLENRDRLVAGQVVDAVRRLWAQRGNHSLGEVLDVHEAPGLLAGTGDGQRLALSALAVSAAITVASRARGP